MGSKPTPTANFRCWLQADIQPSEIDFRSTPNTGHSVAHAGLPVLTQRRSQPYRRKQRFDRCTMREMLVKIGAKVVSRGRHITFQLAEVAMPRNFFQKILSLIDDLRRRPVPA